MDILPRKRHWLVLSAASYMTAIIFSGYFVTLVELGQYLLIDATLFIFVLASSYWSFDEGFFKGVAWERPEIQRLLDLLSLVPVLLCAYAIVSVEYAGAHFDHVDWVLRVFAAMAGEHAGELLAFKNRGEK